MPKLTQISFINTATSGTSFVVTNNSITKRINYQKLKESLVNDILTDGILIGPTGPKGDSGYSGYSGTSGYSGESGSGGGGTNPGAGNISGYSGVSGYSGYSGTSGYSGNSGYSGSPGSGVPIGGSTGQTLVKLSNTNYDVGWTTGPQVGLRSRETLITTTTNIANNGIADISFTGHKGYILYKISTSHASFVTVYTDTTSRTNDSSRSELTDPIPGAGVIADVITVGNQTIKMTPGVVGFNDEAVPTTSIPVRIKNLSGSSAAITVSLTILGIEQ